MDSYLPRQISQSGCEISSNCGKNTNVFKCLDQIRHCCCGCMVFALFETIIALLAIHSYLLFAIQVFQTSAKVTECYSNPYSQLSVMTKNGMDD